MMPGEKRPVRTVPIAWNTAFENSSAAKAIHATPAYSGGIALRMRTGPWASLLLPNPARPAQLVRIPLTPPNH